jgi:hypothetical protein
MGGEITVQSIGNGDYVVAMVVYRDTTGIQMQPTAIFEVFDSVGNVYMTFTTPYDSSISGNLLPQYPYGIELYLFVDTINVPDPGKYRIGWDNCCRNVAIQNLANPGSESMYIQSEFEVFASSSNSTPFFMVPAAVFLPVNTPWQYNPLPFDPDGDSLYWSLDAPMNSANSYCAGYVPPASTASNPFSIDPVTGTISWTASTQGNFVSTVLVEEFRNGQKVGSIRRDMQFVVTSPGNVPLLVGTSNWATNSQGNYSFPIVAGNAFNLSIVADHNDPTAQLDMAIYGEVMNISANPATFSYVPTGVGAEIIGSLFWSVPQQLIAGDQFLNVVRISDGLYTYDETFYMEVVSGVGQEENVFDEPVLFPNPVKDMLNLYIGNILTSGVVDAQIVNMRGQLVAEKEKMNIKAGTNVIQWPVQLSKGMYFLKLSVDQKKYSLPFIVE